MRLQLKKIDQVRPWVAVLVGHDPRYLFKREFLQPTWAGDVATFELDDNPVLTFDVNEACGVTTSNKKGVFRYYAKIDRAKGELVKLDLHSVQNRMSDYYRYVRTGRLPFRFQLMTLMAPAQATPQPIEQAPLKQKLLFLENDAGDVLRWNPVSEAYDCVTEEYEDDELKL